MKAGRIWRCDRYQLRVQANISLGGVITPADGAGGTIETGWWPSTSTYQPGIILTAGRKGMQARYIRLQIPALNVDTGNLYGGTGNGTIEGLLEIDDLAVHAMTTGTLWRVSWSAMRLYRDGTQVWSLGAGVYSDPLTCDRLAPTGLPILGVPPIISASCQALMPSEPDCTGTGSDLYSNVGPHSVTVTGGWRYLQGGSWVQPPVRLSMVSPPAPTSCACTTPSMLWPSASDTWSAALSADIGGTGGAGSFTGSRREMSLMLSPDQPRRIDRLNPDYASLWVRGGLPAIGHLGEIDAHDCVGYQQPTADCTTSELTVVHPGHTEMLSVAYAVTGVIDEPMTMPVWAPYSSESYVYTIGSWQASCHTLRRARWHVTETSRAIPALRPTDPWAVYVDTWASPHWSYFYWFPPPSNPDDPIQSWEWPVDGERVQSEAYWMPLRVQWLHHPALPESPDWRVHLHLGSILENPWYDRWKTFCFPSSPVGISQYRVLQISPPSYIQTGVTASGSWSISGCTATFSGGNIVLGAGVKRVAELTLTPLTRPPYAYESWISLLGFYWTTNVSGVLIEGIDSQGASGNIYQGSTVPSAQPVPAFPQTRYGGTWAIDRGCGLTLDMGADVASGGVSASLMAEPTHRMAMRLGGMAQLERLRLTFTPIATGTSITMSQPVRYRSGQAARQFRPDSGAVDIVWSADAGVHLGDWSWYDGLNILPLPQIYDHPRRQHAVDMLCDAAVASGIPASSLVPIATGWYDAVELTEWRDLTTNTYGMWADRPAVWPDLWVVHPAGMMPPVYLGGTGQIVIDHATSIVWHVAAGSGAVTLTAATPISSMVVPGWVATGYRLPVTNDETSHLWYQGRKIASVRPWWGSLGSPMTPASGIIQALRTAIACWYWGIRAWGSDEVASAYDSWQTPRSGPSLSLTGPGSSISAALARDGVAYLAVGPRLYASHDGGATYSSMVVTGCVQLALVPGGRHALAVDSDGYVRVIGMTGATLYPCTYGGSQLRVTPGCLSVAEETTSSRRWYIGCQLYGQSDVSWLVSDDDGQSWRQL